MTTRATDAIPHDVQRLRVAAELFDRGAYLECHELLEELWREGRGPAQA